MVDMNVAYRQHWPYSFRRQADLKPSQNWPI